MNPTTTKKYWKSAIKKIEQVKRILICSFVCMLFVACSNDESSEDNTPESTVAELLIDNSPWAFTEYQLIEITDLGTSTMTKDEIETQVNSDFNQLELSFYADGTGILIAPILNSAITWELRNNGNLLYMIVEELTPPDDETTFTKVTISQTEMQLENHSTVYDESSDYNVGIVGTMIFNSN